MTKTCSKCQVEKPLGEFNKHRGECKKCKREYNKIYYKKNNPEPAKRKEKKSLLASLGVKTCSMCGEEKAFNKFHKHKKTTDGFRGECKKCQREYNKEYFTIPENKKKRYNYQKIWIKKNELDQKKYRAKWYQLNKEKMDLLNKQRLEEMPAGIYKITNKKTGVFYIGCSTQIPNRLQTHKRTLKKNKHDNKLLQEAYNEYGLDAFEFEVIKEYPADTPFEVLEKEETKLILENHIKGVPMYNLSIKINSIDENLLTK